MSAMPSHRLQLPSKIRLLGEPRDETWAQLGAALAAHYARALRRGIDELERARGVTLLRSQIRERFDPARLAPEGYLVPSYEGASTRVPAITAAPSATPATDPVLSRDEIVARIRSAFPETDGRPSGGVHFGVYARWSENPTRRDVYFLDPVSDVDLTLKSFFLYLEVGGERTELALEDDFYTVVMVSSGRSELHRAGKLVRADLANPELVNLAISFVVGDPGRPGAAPARAARRIFPAMHIIRLRRDAEMATGYESAYVASVVLWEVDERGRVRGLEPAAMLPQWFASVTTYGWEVRRVEQDGSTTLLRSVSGTDSSAAALRHTWTDPGTYQVRCTVAIAGPWISPAPVGDQLAEEVVDVRAKMALTIAVAEARMPGAWSSSAASVLRALEDEIRRERAKPNPSEAKVREFQERLEEARLALFPAGGMIGPFPLRGVFTLRATSQTIPVSLFLGAEYDPGSSEPYVWHLIDLTYPPFYATRTARAADPLAARRKLMEVTRTALRSRYPPGFIFVTVPGEELKRHGIAELFGIEPRDQELFTETDSQLREALQLAGIITTGITGAGLVLTGVGSPAGVWVLAVTGVAAAGLSAANIVARINEGSLRADRELFTDIVTIAAGITQLGGAVTAARAASVARAITVEGFTLGAGSTLAQLLRAQKVFIILGLAGDVTRGVILIEDTYTKIINLDLAVGPDVLEAYIKVYGEEEGRKRWENERTLHVLRVLAQAAVQGALIAISIAGGVRQLRQISTAQADVESDLEQVRALLAKPPEEMTIQEVREAARHVSSGRKGSIFEQWANEHVFHGQKTRITILKEKNPQLDWAANTTSQRSSDNFYRKHSDNSMWDFKLGYEGSKIDPKQLEDYALMAGRKVVTEEFGALRMKSVNYVFASKAGAENNLQEVVPWLRSKVIKDPSYELIRFWYIDEAGTLKLLH
jgi:hypothetical protein